MEESIILAISMARRELAHEMVRRAVEAGLVETSSLEREQHKTDLLQAQVAMDATAQGLLPSARVLLMEQEGISRMVRGTALYDLRAGLEDLDFYLQQGGRIGAYSASYTPPFSADRLNPQWKLLLATIGSGDCLGVARALDLLITAAVADVNGVQSAKYSFQTELLLALQGVTELLSVHLATGGSVDECPDPEPFSDPELDAVWQEFHRALAASEKPAVIRALYILVMAAEDEVESPDFEFTLQGEQDAGSSQPN